MDENVVDDEAKHKLNNSLLLYKYGGFVIIVGFVGILAYILFKDSRRH